MSGKKRGPKPDVEIISPFGKKAQSEVEIPPAPAWLSSEGQEKYLQICQVLKGIGRFTANSADLCVLYAVAWNELRVYTQALAQQGRFVPQRGRLVPHPAVKLQASALETLGKLTEQLGLTSPCRSSSEIDLDVGGPSELQQFFDEFAEH